MNYKIIIKHILFISTAVLIGVNAIIGADIQVQDQELRKKQDLGWARRLKSFIQSGKLSDEDTKVSYLKDMAKKRYVEAVNVLLDAKITEENSLKKVRSLISDLEEDLKNRELSDDDRKNITKIIGALEDKLSIEPTYDPATTGKHVRFEDVSDNNI